MIRLLITFILAVMTFVPMYAHGFGLDPYSEYDKNSMDYRSSFLSSFKFTPRHEQLTLKAINASRISSDYKSSEFREGVIRGIRWNDDPLSFARANGHIYYLSFKDSCDHSETVDPSWDLLYRTHCGDMQFLHAMASTPYETSKVTREKIMMWLEFSFKVSSGEIDKDWRFVSLAKQYLERNTTWEWAFNYLMTNNGTIRLDWQPEWLFTLHCGRWFTWSGLFFRARLTELTCDDLNNQFTEQEIQDIALGSLLHLLQDSFSRSHVLRDRSGGVEMSAVSGVGRILQFGNYGMQDQELHGKADLTISYKDFHKEFDLIDISARIIELAVMQRGDNRSRWQEAKEMLDRVFEVVEPSKLPGDIGYK